MLNLGSLFSQKTTQMGLQIKFNTMFNTTHQLQLNTVIVVSSSAISQLLIEFVVISPS